MDPAPALNNQGYFVPGSGIRREAEATEPSCPLFNMAASKYHHMELPVGINLAYYALVV